MEINISCTSGSCHLRHWSFVLLTDYRALFSNFKFNSLSLAPSHLRCTHVELMLVIIYSHSTYNFADKRASECTGVCAPFLCHMCGPLIGHDLYKTFLYKKNSYFSFSHSRAQSVRGLLARIERTREFLLIAPKRGLP
jgi:hypothetical protein